MPHTRVQLRGLDGFQSALNGLHGVVEDLPADGGNVVVFLDDIHQFIIRFSWQFLDEQWLPRECINVNHLTFSDEPWLAASIPSESRSVEKSPLSGHQLAAVFALLRIHGWRPVRDCADGRQFSGFHDRYCDMDDMEWKDFCDTKPVIATMLAHYLSRDAGPETSSSVPSNASLRATMEQARVTGQADLGPNCKIHYGF